MSLRPFVPQVEAELGKPVRFFDNLLGPVQREIKYMQPGEVVLLENVRFLPREDQNDPVTAAAPTERELGGCRIRSLAGIHSRS